MSKKPKIAFCFSWQARTLDQTYLFFQKNLFDAAIEQWFDYDVFCAVEDDEDVDKINLLNPTKVEKIKSTEIKKIIDKEYPNNFEEFREKYWFIDLDWTYLVNNLQQFYKVQKSILLMKNFWENKKLNYDIVVRLRFDFIFFNKLNFIRISDVVKNWEILCNKYDTSKFFIKIWEINDFFFFWTEKSMLFLWSLFDNFLLALKWDEIRKSYKFIHNVFRKIKKFFIYVNSRLWHWIIPIWEIRLIESCFYKLHTPELIYYKYFLIHEVPVIKTKFSYILVRKDVKKSEIKLELKNEYEL